MLGQFDPAFLVFICALINFQSIEAPTRMNYTPRKALIYPGGIVEFAEFSS